MKFSDTWGSYSLGGKAYNLGTLGDHDLGKVSSPPNYTKWFYVCPDPPDTPNNNNQLLFVTNIQVTVETFQPLNLRLILITHFVRDCHMKYS